LLFSLAAAIGDGQPLQVFDAVAIAIQLAATEFLFPYLDAGKPRRREWINAAGNHYRADLPVAPAAFPSKPPECGNSTTTSLSSRHLRLHAAG
jgi:hypothetical protein